MGRYGKKAEEMVESAMHRRKHGTLRSGTDPATSVCRPDGRFHDVGNLYCADASLFPTSSGFNPTLTIQALSYMTADAIVNKYKKNPGRLI